VLLAAGFVLIVAALIEAKAVRRKLPIAFKIGNTVLVR